MIPWHEPWTVLGTLLMEDEETGALIDAMEWDALFRIIEAVEAFNAMMGVPSLMCCRNSAGRALRRDLRAWQSERARRNAAGG